MNFACRNLIPGHLRNYENFSRIKKFCLDHPEFDFSVFIGLKRSLNTLYYAHKRKDRDYKCVDSRRVIEFERDLKAMANVFGAKIAIWLWIATRSLAMKNFSDFLLMTINAFTVGQSICLQAALLEVLQRH